VLSPRHDIGCEKKRKKRTEDGNYRHPIFLGLSAIQLSDPQVQGVPINMGIK